MDYIVRIVEAVAWPVAVLFIGFLFRRELRIVVSRMSHMKYGGFEAKFEKALAEAEKQAKEISVSPKQESAPEIQFDETFERLNRLVAVSPKAAVMESWREVEIATKRAAESKGIRIAGLIAGIKHVDELTQFDRNLIKILPLYARLRTMRNQAAHAMSFELSPEEAERYVVLATEVVEELERVGRKPANNKIQPTAESGG